ncbi:MAG: cbb3-type cytochrome oxidase assembly protein CcoS [Verrucomicrobia bacterium]|nr:MAG: cbb3-type cytochrome oxidase assembly protein CcoS [Verrucomicrobiota bacterium]
MNVILLLIPLSLLMAGGFLWAFVWAVRSGQYEDTCTPSMRVLADDGTIRRPGEKSTETEPRKS